MSSLDVNIGLVLIAQWMMIGGEDRPGSFASLSKALKDVCYGCYKVLTASSASD
jgi:hypothetical protein